MEMKKTPVLRFKGFAGEWETKKISDIAERVTRKNTELQSTLPLTISAQYGLVDQVTYFNNRVAGQNIQNYYLIKNGEFAYNKSSSDGYPWGAVKRLDNYNAGILSTLYIVFSLKNAMIDSDFLKTYFDTNHWYKHVSECAAEGARNHGLLNISAEDFLDSELALSNELEEQKEIGACFARLDAVLALARRRAERLAAVKRAMLAALFPKEGKTLPALRFQGFSGDWQRQRLGDLAQFTKGAGYSKADLRANGTPIILYGRLYTKYETVISDVDTFAAPKDGSLYSKGGEVIVPASGETAEDISVASVVEKPGVLLGGDLNVIRASESIDPVFLAITISHGKAHEDMSKMAQGKTVVHLHNTDLETLELLYPSLEEQEMIGAYFRRLDEIISLQARRAEKLTALKKALLGRMFV